MGNKGILSRKRERWLARFFDGLTNFGFVGEFFDRAVFLGIIAGIDDLIIAKKASQETINFFEDFFELIEKRDFDALQDFLAGIATENINTPLTDTHERKVVVAALTFLNTYIQWAVNEAAKIAEQDGDDYIIND